MEASAKRVQAWGGQEEAERPTQAPPHRRVMVPEVGGVHRGAITMELNSELTGWSHLCYCGRDQRLAMMVDGSSLFVPATLVLLYGLMFLVAGISLLTVIPNLQAGRKCFWWRRWWRQAAAPEPGAERQAGRHSSPRSEPWCPCSKADQELQQLVLSGLPGCRPVLGPDFWQAAWRDLEELVEQNSLSCHCCSSREGQAEARRHPGKKQQDHQGHPKESAKIPLPLGAAPKETQRPAAAAALPGPARATLRKDSSAQTDTSDLLVADTEATGRQCHCAVPDSISKPQLGQMSCMKVSMHTARKCLDVNLHVFPETVRRPTELLQHPQPTHGAPASTLKRKCPLHPDQVPRQQHGARAPGCHRAPTYFCSREAWFLPEEEREALELHTCSMKQKHPGNQPAASWEKESTSTYQTAPSEADWAEAGAKGHKRWPWCKNCPGRGESTWSTKAERSSSPPGSVTF